MVMAKSTIMGEVFRIAIATPIAVPITIQTRTINEEALVTTTLVAMSTKTGVHNNSNDNRSIIETKVEIIMAACSMEIKTALVAMSIGTTSMVTKFYPNNSSFSKTTLTKDRTIKEKTSMSFLGTLRLL